MDQHIDLGKLVLDGLDGVCRVTKKDVGADAHLSKNGMAFDTEAYDVEGLGHLCIMRMKAMLGLMKMETVVLSSVKKDLPLINLDWVRAMGRETQIAELYDTQLSPLSDDVLARFQALRDRDADLPDPEKSEHWYDSILYPCSYHKVGKKISARLSAAAQDYLKTFISLIPETPDCDEEAKKEKVRGFAETLFAKGGPAVDQMTKLFGKETARRVVVRHMYGISD